jgi:hypothetical protein
MTDFFTSSGPLAILSIISDKELGAVGFTDLGGRLLNQLLTGGRLTARNANCDQQYAFSCAYSRNGGPKQTFAAS